MSVPVRIVVLGGLDSKLLLKIGFIFEYMLEQFIVSLNYHLLEQFTFSLNSQLEFVQPRKSLKCVAKYQLLH